MSTIQKSLILVDEDNKPIGTGEKMDVHRKGLLHRAFSIFVYDPDSENFLIQRRASDKYHSGDLWANTCCSHPYQEETEEGMLQRALIDELNFKKEFKIVPFDTLDLSKDSLKNHVGEMLYLDNFKYFSDYGEMKEHEHDSVYLYIVDQGYNIDQNFNLEEISELQWITLDNLEKWYENNPEQFSSWFPKVFDIVKTNLRETK